MPQQRRKPRFEDWDAVLADVERLRAGGYDRAERGNWSLGQVCDHLGATMEMAVGEPQKLMPWPMRMMARTLALKKLLRHEQIGMRVKAPASITPPDEVSDEVGIDRYRAAVERFRGHGGEYNPHIGFGRLSRDEWNELMLWHAEHHLSFLVPRGSGFGTG